MPVSALSVISVLVVLLAVTDAVYINYYDESAKMECRSDEYMSYIGSIHNDDNEDRRWEFRCRKGNMGACSWSNYVNDFDELLAYICPGNRVIAGMNSYHDNGPEDRRFRFKCCDVIQKKPDDCYFTGLVNSWDGPLSVSAPPGTFIKGAASDHDNYYEDRRWRFLLCT